MYKHFIHIHRRTPGLLLPFGYREWCCCEHGCKNTCLHSLGCITRSGNAGSCVIPMFNPSLPILTYLNWRIHQPNIHRVYVCFKQSSWKTSSDFACITSHLTHWKPLTSMNCPKVPRTSRPRQAPDWAQAFLLTRNGTQYGYLQKCRSDSKLHPTLSSAIAHALGCGLGVKIQ